MNSAEDRPIIEARSSLVGRSDSRELVPYGREIPHGTDGPADAGRPANAIPGVLVLDTSWSMEMELGTISSAIDEFIRGLRRVPAVSEQAHMAVVTFADRATTVLDFCRIADPRVSVSSSNLSPQGNGTNFRAAFDEVYRTLDAGLPRLARTAEGERRTVMRPTIYFVSDGMPNLDVDGWRDSLARLVAPRWRPNRFAFGFGAMDRDVLREIGDQGCAYFADDGGDPLGALERILRVVLQSMVSISEGVVGGHGHSTAPPPVPGLVRLDPI